MAMLIQILIALIIAGVLIWAFKHILAIIPMDDWLRQVANTILTVAVVLIVVFVVLVPLLHQLPSLIHF